MEIRITPGVEVGPKRVDPLKVQDWIRQYWPDGCAVCGNKAFDLSSEVAELRQWRGGTLVLGPAAPIWPLVVLTCDRCGNTHLLNAIKAGLVTVENGQVVPSPGGN